MKPKSMAWAVVAAVGFSALAGVLTGHSIEGTILFLAAAVWGVVAILDDKLNS